MTSSFMKEFEHLKIPLEEIKRATNSFSNKVIGSGGFGAVYEGDVSHSRGRSIVAIKRLNRQFGQGDAEFLKEIMLLSRCTHQNLVSILGFCDEEGEKVLVYEFASKGSLDRHLSDPDLTWVERIKICLGAAKGLCYLHDPKGKHQRVLHCDIKSANILLDESLTAKVADFGLSKMAPANQQYSLLVTNALGTPGYCDPLFMKTYTLTKESDVYSFGVVLFEVLCGRLCYEYSNGKVKLLVNMWKKKFSENKISEIVFQHLEPQMVPTSLELFSGVAFQCLHDSHEDRPTMSIVVEKLEKALKSQEVYNLKLPEVYKEILNVAVTPLRFTSIDELNQLLSIGVFLNAGKTWFSRNDKGVHYVFKSMKECLIEEAGERYHHTFSFDYNSRFPTASLTLFGRSRLKTCVKTEFLSPLMTYTVNLVFKFLFRNETTAKQGYIWLYYKLAGEMHTRVSHFAYKREDNWWTIELYHFISDGTTVDLEIIFEPWLGFFITVDGIEFQLLEVKELQVLEDDKKHVSLEPTSLSDNEDDTYWENKLPTDYKDIIKFSEQSLQWKTNKELYYILSKGLLINYKSSFSFFQPPINHGQQWFCLEWFCLDKNGKTCLMLPATAVCSLETSNWWKWKSLTKWKSLPESRFGKGLVISSSDCYKYIVIKENKFRVLSPQTEYACYLVYKTKSRGGCTSPIVVLHKDLGSTKWKYGSQIYLVSPQTPVIRPKAGQNTHNPLYRPKLKGIPQQRSDGWMEVQVCEFQTNTTMSVFPSLKLECQTKYPEGHLKGLIIMGIEFRPI